MSEDSTPTERNNIFPDGILWHFTQTDSLASILQKGIRATHSSCLSDETEGLLRGIMRTIAMKLFLPLTTEEFILLEERQQTILDLVKTGVNRSVFVACFSEAPDFEMMWERYTPFGGIAIGFKESAVKSLESPERLQCEMIKQLCDYHRYEQKEEEIERQKTLADAIAEMWKTHEGDPSLKRITENLIRELEQAATDMIFVKRRVFEFEHEFRLAFVFPQPPPLSILQYEHDKLFFHIKPNGTPKDFIEKLIVSPRGDAARNLRIARILGQSCGIAHENIQLWK